MRARFHRRPWVGWAVLAGLTAATYAGALAVWASLARSFPERIERPSQARGITHWVKDGEVPLTIEGRLEGASTLVIGDSRTWMAVDRAVLDGSRFGPSCVLWGSGGDLRVLLDEAAKRSPERLVVGLSPHSMGPDSNRVFTEVARERFPVFRAKEASPSSVRRWRREEQVHLEGLGFPANLVSIFLDRLQNQFLRERALHRDPRARLEAWLDAKVQRFRFDHVYTVKPARWRRSWLSVNDPTIDEAPYRMRLGTDRFQEGREGFRQEIIDRLRVVAAKTPTVVVRFPLSPQVRAAEDETAPAAWLAEIAEIVGVPYVDFGTTGVTADGSHVTTDTATRLTADLVQRLEAMDLKLVPGVAPAEAAVRQGGLSGYRLEEPELDLRLPDELREISGIVSLGAGSVGCIQDERGDLYRFSLASPDALASPVALARTPFGPKGDYEALTRADDRLFVLRSDGVLQELDLEGRARGGAVELGANLPDAEYESLCFQPEAERLLFAPKVGARDGDQDIPVFGVDLGAMKVSVDPVLTVSVKQLIERAGAKGWPLPEKTTKKGGRKVDFGCRISDMAVHPITGQLYVLCGPDRTLLVLDRNGDLEGTAVFPKSILPQPEGLAFEPSGDLLLTSEGQDGPARLLKFGYRSRD
ncbi:hypothetical protein Poly30_16250 [Planctomycetes bacterium Poly30]|uniref:Uncharacterized protein n=1 Tax=Saltatorellus ferox TaxID=2528018 RepID=A0A518EPW3_9BACT|nr:hypothetical protein Poly30_16250 [Planctomycetes bacterium Poly30]